MREFISNQAGVIQGIMLLAILGIPIAIVVAIIFAIVISLVWGILAFIGLILVFIGGYALISKKSPKFALILVLIGITLVICSSTLGLEIGTLDFSGYDFARYLNQVI